MKRNKVLVLLATWNGSEWLPEQLSTILAQSDCDISVLISDDHSVDETLSVVDCFSKTTNQIKLLQASPGRFRNANRNFINLIINADVEGVDYIALSDQDDLWFINKISRALSVFYEHSIDAYSSNVIAVWPNGSKKLLNKSGKQKTYDFLFESAGPGCTFVFKTGRFLELRNWLNKNFVNASEFIVHDWLIYAYARSHYWNWFIDRRPGMYYRQHPRNEIGANVGFRPKIARFQQFVSGKYLYNVSQLAKLINIDARLRLAIKRMHFRDAVYLIYHAYDYRRRYSEVWSLRLLILIFWLKRRSANDY